MRGDIKAGRAYVELLLDRKQFQKNLQHARQELVRFSQDMQSLGRSLALVAAAMLVPLTLSTQTFAAFDDKMREVKAVSRSNVEEFARLTAEAKRLGATTSFTAIQIAGLMAELGRAGFSADQVNEMTGAVLDLARATVTDATRASGIMAASIRQFNLAGKDATRVADALTMAANASFNSVESIGEALSYAGPVADDFNMTIEETLAILGALGNVGIQGSNAGTALRRLLTITGAQAEKLNRIFGVGFTDAAGNARPLVQVLEEVGRATANLGSAERAAKFDEAFGILGITSASVIAKNASSTKELLEQIENAAGVARTTAKEMDAGIGGSFRMLWSAVEGTAIAIGSALQEELIALTDLFTEGVGKVLEFIEAHREMVVMAAQVAVALGLLSAGLMGAGTALLVVLGSARIFGSAFGVVTSLFGLATAATKPMNRATLALTKSMQGAAQTAGQWTAALTRFTGISSAVGQVSGFFLQRLQLMQQGVLSWGAQTRQALAGVSTQIKSFIRGLWETGSLTGAVQKLGTVFSLQLRGLEISVLRWSHQTRLAFQAVLARATSFAQGLQSAASLAGTVFSRLADYPRVLFPRAFGMATGALQNLTGRAQAAANQISQAWEGVRDRVRSSTAVWTGYLQDRVSQASRFLQVRLGQAYGLLQQQTRRALVPIQQTFARAADMATRAWLPIAGRIAQAFAPVMPLIRRDLASLQALATRAAGVVQVVWQGIWPAVSTRALAVMQTAFARILTMSKTTAATMGNYLAAGFASATRGLTGAVAGTGMLASILGGAALGPIAQLLMLAPLVISAVGAIGAGLLALLTPFGLLTAGIVGMVAAFAAVRLEGDSLAEKAEDLRSRIMPAIGELTEFVQQAFRAAQIVADLAWSSVEDSVTGAMETIKQTAIPVLQWLKETVIASFSAAAFTMQNWALIGEIAMRSVVLGMVSMVNDLAHTLTVAVPAYLNWFVENWQDVFQTALSVLQAFAVNVFTNLTNLGAAIGTWLGGGGFEFTWTPLLDGFENTMKRLPEIAAREMGLVESVMHQQLSGLQQELSSAWDQHEADFNARLQTSLDRAAEKAAEAYKAEEEARIKKQDAAVSTQNNRSAALTDSIVGSFSAAALRAMGGATNPQQKVVEELKQLRGELVKLRDQEREQARQTIRELQKRLRMA